MLLMCSSCATGQVHVPDRTCIQNDLSKALTILTTAKRVHQDQSFDSVRLTIRIIDKSSKRLLQEISLIAPDLYAEDYTQCRLVRSYSTGKDARKKVVDNDYGDIIVADLNFDSREDLAVKTENNNGGTDYTFYTQTKDKKFVLDRYLTDSVYSFPWKINSNKRTLTTMVRAGVGDALTTYHLDSRTNRWARVKRRVI